MPRAGLVFILVAVASLQSLANAREAPAVDKRADGVVLAVADSFLRVELCAADIVHVAYAKDRATLARVGLAATPRRCTPPAWELKRMPGQIALLTDKIEARVELATGAVSFFDRSGQPILAESRGGRTLTPAVVQEERTFHVRQEWEPSADEALYGLGQHQLGLMNIKGYDLDLWQHNGTVVVPFLVSSRGYGILWDNTSFTRFGDLRQPAPIPATRLYDSTGKPGGLSASFFADDRFERVAASRVDASIDIQLPGDAKQSNKLIHPDLPAEGNVSVRWEGSFESEAAGDYTFRTFSNNGVRLWIDDRLVIDHWRQGWLPWLDVARLRLEAHQRYRLKLEWYKEQGMETIQLLWKTPSPEKTTALWSEVGDGIDYTFVYGPELDAVVAGYRRLTGPAPMMPLWSHGLWQCRQRYKTAQESLDVLAGYRSRGIPIDNIVQDWFYWKEDQWGSHEFDPARFPDPAGWVREIHERFGARLMISVWPKFYPGTKHFDVLNERGFLYQPNLKEGIKDWVGYPDTFYDAFSADARKLFWAQMESKLFKLGIDAWWLDATEPDLTPTPTLDGQRSHVHPTALGTGARMLNAYSVLHSQGVYEGQRQAAPNRRVFILTRSGFAGQQRYAAAVWSGDISSTWQAFWKQIPAGLSFSLSGVPYWTTDIGGFSVPARFSSATARPEDVEEWRELNTRWFQFGTFCPLLRVHGESPNREMWEFGGESHPAYKTQLKFDRLRYRLMPYIYSLAANVAHDSGTLMRPLVMDFRTDARARETSDQFMFGPALLVSPVTKYQARSRSVYLPKATWYDFWTGAPVSGARTLDVPAPYDSLPLHVRAGSIVPLGPEIQRTAEKPADPITLYVYAGADGAFTLYEDDGLTYDYERGLSARIPLAWDDATHTLTIGQRQGSFPGMLATRRFEVVLISKAKPVGFSFEPKAERVLSYSGEALSVRLD